MINCFKRKPSNLLGVDISHTSMTLVGVKRTANDYQVIWHDFCYLPENVIINNEITAPAVMARCMQRLLQHSPVRWKKAVVAVPDSAIITKTMLITAGLKSTEIEAYIESELDQIMTQPREKINYDFEILGPSRHYPDLLDVRVVAAKASCVTQRVNLLAQLGIKVLCVGVVSYALSKFIRRTYGAVLAILYLDFHHMHFWILNGEKRCFSHEENRGIAPLLEQAMQQSGQSRQQVLKTIEQGNLKDKREVSLWNAYSQLMIDFCRRALQQYGLAQNSLLIDTIWLVGEVANGQEIAERVKQALGIDVLQVNPFAAITCGKQMDDPGARCILPLSLALYLS